MLDLILVIVTLIWLIFASLSDIKTSEVPNWLSFSLIAIGIFIILARLTQSTTLTSLFWPAISFLIALSIALLLYYTKQWGGGDAKLLMGLGLVFAVYPDFLLKFFSPNLDLPLFIIFLINTLIAGVIYSLLFSFGLLIKHFKSFKPAFKQLSKKTFKPRLIALLIALILVVIWFISPNQIILLTALFSILTFFFFYTLAFAKAIEKSCMIERIKPSKLQEGDWILEDIKTDKLIYSKKSLGVSKEQIELIKKHNIKDVLIKKGIPFVPSFLLGAILTYIFGNVLTTILKLFI